MSRENLETVERILAGWGNGDLGIAIPYFDEQVVYFVDRRFPESGTFMGPAAIRDYMAGFLAQWEHYAMEGQEIRSAGDTIVARLLQRGQGKSSGVDTEAEMFAIFTFRGGKIIRLDMVPDEEAALEAAGPLTEGGA